MIVSGVLIQYHFETVDIYMFLIIVTSILEFWSFSPVIEKTELQTSKLVNPNNHMSSSFEMSSPIFDGVTKQTQFVLLM